MPGRSDRPGSAPGGRALVLGAAVVAFVALSAVQWTRPAIEDEALMQRASLRWLAGDFDPTGLAHTPLYMEATVLWQGLAGPAEPGDGARVMRWFGTLCAAATLALFVWGQRRLGGGSSAWLFAAALALHPYFVGASLLIDMDTTLLPPLLLLWVVLVEMWDRAPRGGVALTAAAAAVFAVAMMVKELTPLVCLPVWVACAASRGLRRPGESARRHVVESLAGCAAGALAFLGLLAAWSALRDLPMTAPFENTFRRLGEGDGGATGLTPWARYGFGRWAAFTYLPLAWLCLPAVVGTVLALARGTRPTLRSAASAPIAWWLAAAVFAAYTWIGQLSYYFPKYTACALVLAVFGAAQVGADFARRCDEPATVRWGWRVWALLGVLVIAGLAPQLDPLMITEARAAWASRAHAPDGDPALSPLAILATHVAALAIPIAAIVAVDVLRRRGRAPETALAAAILVHLAALSAGHALRERSPGYLYGESGFTAALAQVRNVARAEDGAPRVVSTFADLAIAYGEDARVLEPGADLAAESDRGRRVLVSRTYGTRAVRENPRWRDEAARLYARHEVVDAPGGRFELWWNP